MLHNGEFMSEIEGTWNQGGEIEVPCRYCQYRDQKDRRKET